MSIINKLLNKIDEAKSEEEFPTKVRAKNNILRIRLNTWYYAETVWSGIYYLGVNDNPKFTTKKNLAESDYDSIKEFVSSYVNLNNLKFDPDECIYQIAIYPKGSVFELTDTERDINYRSDKKGFKVEVDSDHIQGKKLEIKPISTLSVDPDKEWEKSLLSKALKDPKLFEIID